jgi:hypothetical protein
MLQNRDSDLNGLCGGSEYIVSVRKPKGKRLLEKRIYERIILKWILKK